MNSKMTGFGGACPQGYTTVKVSGGELPACYTVAADGIRHWEQMNKELATTSFSGRAYTADAKQASADAVLAVLGTLSFEPAGATAPTPVAIANPASQNCVAKGGKLQIEERGDGGQIGVCYFEDNLQCEEWALAWGDCPLGGVNATGYTTPAARYCAITGGKYTATGTTPDGQEDGTCALPNVVVCGAWQYYNGYCGASSQ